MSISITTFAIILLIGHLIAAGFIFSVLRKQAALLREPIDRNYRTFRLGLFALSMIIFIGTLVPIAIDTITLFVDTQRPSQIYTISLVYASSNMVRDIASAAVIFLLYRISSNSHRP